MMLPTSVSWRARVSTPRPYVRLNPLASNKNAPAPARDPQRFRAVETQRNLPGLVREQQLGLGVGGGLGRGRGWGLWWRSENGEGELVRRRLGDSRRRGRRRGRLVEVDDEMRRAIHGGEQGIVLELRLGFELQAWRWGGRSC